MTKKTDMTGAAPDDDDLEMFFTAARSKDIVPSRDLMNRILQDAANVQADQATPPIPRHKDNWILQVTAFLGGWRGMSALTACAASGVIIGFSTPDTVANMSFGIVPIDSISDVSYQNLFGLEEFDGFDAEAG